MMESNKVLSQRAKRFLSRAAVLGAVLVTVSACAVVGPPPPPYAVAYGAYPYYDYPPYYSTSVVIGGFGHDRHGGYHHGGRHHRWRR